MNSSPKANMGGIPQFNSMVTNGVGNAFNIVGNAATAAKNAVFNTASAAKNAVSNAANAAMDAIPTSISEPIAASINAVPEPESLWVSLPLILGIGVLVVAFTLVVIFRAELEALWSRFTNWLMPPAPAATDDGAAAAPAQADAAAIAQKILPGKKDVFNVAENRYTFADAEPLCKALGAELATYDQVREAWGKGADWCNYGWVKGQAAVYPTQQATYDKLQNEGTDEQRMSCGTVGVNGGYFDNPELRFGVNCYGPKPAESEHSIERVMKGDDRPLTPEALAFDKKVASYKAHSSEIAVNPFAPGTWA